MSANKDHKFSENLKALKISYGFSKTIINNPIKYFCGFLLMISLGAPFLFHIKSEWSQRMWFDESHEIIKSIDLFEKIFGPNEYISIVVRNHKGIFNKETLQTLKSLTEKMWQTDGIIRVESLTNIDIIEGMVDSIDISPLLPDELLLTQKNIKEKENIANKNREFVQYNLNKLNNIAIVLGVAKPELSSNIKQLEKLVKDINGLAKDHQSKNLEIYVLGPLPANISFKDVSNHDTFTLLPLMILLILILLYWQFRSITSMILPIILTTATIAITFSFLSILEIKYNSLLGAIPGILFAICIADTVHVLTSFYYFFNKGLSARESILYALTKNFRPTLLTSISTGISFFSLTTTDIAPIRDLGILAGFGTLMAWVFTYFFIGPTMTLLAPRIEKSTRRSNRSLKSRQFFQSFIKQIKKFKALIIIFFTTLTVSFVYLGSLNEVNSDPIKYFSQDVPIRKAYDSINSQMDGLRRLELYIDAGAADGIKNPDFLKKVQAFETWALQHEKIKKIESILTIVKMMNQVINGDQKEFYKVPDKQNTIAEILFLYTFSLPPGRDINHLYSVDQRYLRYKVNWNIEKSKEAVETAKYIVQTGREKFGLDIKISGSSLLLMEINDLVVSSFFKSISIALLLVSLLLLFLYRDIKISLLALLPNILPLCFGAGLMTIMGKNIDIGTSIVCTVCLGIAVDDTIHFISNYLFNLKHEKETSLALIKTLETTGIALITTTLLLAIGFGCFILADFVPNHNFGVLSSLILLFALFVDLVFLPAILIKDHQAQK